MLTNIFLPDLGKEELINFWLIHVSYLPLEGKKKQVSVLNKKEWRKAPFLHQEPGLPRQGLPLIPGLTLKPGRPGPLGCSPLHSAWPVVFTASGCPNLFHIPGGSLVGKAIILTRSLHTRFLSHYIRLELRARRDWPPWCCGVPWPLLNQGRCHGRKPWTKPPAQKKAGSYATASLKGASDQSHNVTVKDTERGRRANTLRYEQLQGRLHGENHNWIMPWLLPLSTILHYVNSKLCSFSGSCTNEEAAIKRKQPIWGVSRANDKASTVPTKPSHLYDC